MPTYQDWNDALIKYTLQGLSLGSHVFLSIDEEAIEIIALQFNEPRPPHGWVEEFKRVVRNRCVYNGEVNVPRFAQPLRDTRKYPRYVPFLAAMVFAAYLMGEDEDKNIYSNDYFTHLNSVLGLEGKRGRVSGLSRGEDGKLWEDWASWLRTSGYLPTAYAGEGSEKYIKYPKSQTLLRKADKDKLWRHFTTHGWRKDYDEVLLMQRIRRDAQYLTTHLQDILDPKSEMWLRSYEAISKSCYEVYEDWRESDGSDKRLSASEPRIRTSLDGKIYRTEDFFSGAVVYQIFPRQTRQSAFAELHVTYDGENYTLAEDRPGWYSPLWMLDETQLTDGLKVPITSQNSAIKSLFLPPREFWVLTLDPDTPESGVYASWDKGIQLGTEFILLARQTVQDDLARLRDEGLLSWQSVVKVFDSWYEYHGVIVQSEPQAWTSIHLNNDALRLTLQPRTTFSINFVGGLRAPRGYGWLVGYEPKLSLASFLPDAILTVFDETEEAIYTATIEPGQLIDIPWKQAGNYRLVVEQSGQSDEKIVRILNWSDVPPRLMDFNQIACEFNLLVYGVLVRDK
jgi:hypothetical protein